MEDLGKWPRLVVVGQPVSFDQAAEIIIRTTCIDYLIGNDREWEETIHEIMGLDYWDRTPSENRSSDWFQHYHTKMEQARQRLGILDLSYIHNSQIISSWIGGPHGWCDWEGHIGCSSWNIGKWPSHEEVEQDWTKIAVAFPYLDLRAQLIPNEGEADHAAVEYAVKDGAVTVIDAPAELLEITVDLAIDDIVSRLFSPGGERGCSAERLRRAVELTRQRVSAG